MNQQTDALNDGEPAPVRELRSDWLRLALGIVFIMTVIVSFSYVMSDRPVDATKDGAFKLAFLDNFDRPANSSGLNSAEVDTWKVVTGNWSVQLSGAYLTQSDPKQSLALVKVDNTSMLVQAKISGNGRCGIVSGATDANSFVSLFRAPRYGIWLVNRVANGKETKLGTLPDSGSGTLVISLSVSEDLVRVAVGNSTASFVNRGMGLGQMGGLIAAGDGAPCVWDDVVVQEAR